jgi:hypothetical protein
VSHQPSARAGHRQEILGNAITAVTAEDHSDDDFEEREPDPNRIAATKQIGKKTNVTAAAGLTTTTDVGVPGLAVTKVEHIHDTCAALGKKDDLARDSNATLGPASK